MGKLKQKESIGQTATLAQVIVEARRSAGLSLIQVADYLGVDPGQIRRYESGLDSVPLDQIYALSNCLNISPEVIERILHFS